MVSKSKNHPKSVMRKLRMREEYLDKDVCRKRAQKLIAYNDWKHVTEEQLAKEIYGHAYVYYRWKWLGKLPFANRLIYKHTSDGIDVGDSVDKFRLVWEWIWRKK